jgi:hypothetical protein
LLDLVDHRNKQQSIDRRDGKRALLVRGNLSTDAVMLSSVGAK